MTATLDLPGDTKVEDAKAEDIAHALAQPRDDDWYIIVGRADGDEYIEVSVEDNALALDGEVGTEYLRAQSHIDEELCKSILVDFATGGSAWRDMALWVAPKPVPKSTTPIPMKPPVILGIAWAAMMVMAMIFGKPPIVITVFCLAFPGVIAIAAISKWQDVQRAASWTKGSATILTSELVTKKVNDRDAEVPHVEYEFTVGMNFAKVRGNRISLAEVEGPHGAKETLAKYRVGGTVPVFYDPNNPRESVLERDFPPHMFTTVGVVVGVLTLLILGAGYWFGLR